MSRHVRWRVCVCVFVFEDAPSKILPSPLSSFPRNTRRPKQAAGCLTGGRCTFDSCNHVQLLLTGRVGRRGEVEVEVCATGIEVGHSHGVVLEALCGPGQCVGGLRLACVKHRTRAIKKQKAKQKAITCVCVCVSLSEEAEKIFRGVCEWRSWGGSETESHQDTGGSIQMRGRGTRSRQGLQPPVRGAREKKTKEINEVSASIAGMRGSDWSCQKMWGGGKGLRDLHTAKVASQLSILDRTFCFVEGTCTTASHCQRTREERGMRKRRNREVRGRRR